MDSDKALKACGRFRVRCLLAGYKVPREIRFEPIPKTSTGKIQKFQLRERAKSASAIE
jgi:fatty-acyl-CoA synthase